MGSGSLRMLPRPFNGDIWASQLMFEHAVGEWTVFLARVVKNYFISAVFPVNLLGEKSE